MSNHWVRVAMGLVLVQGVGCGARTEKEGAEHATDLLTLERPSEGVLSGKYRALELRARRLDLLRADVELQINSLAFDARFDFGAGEVVLDGHDMQLDRTSHQLLFEAIPALVDAFGPDSAGLALEERALYAALVSWQQSGGIPVQRTTYPILPAESSGRLVANKSHRDDGVRCVERGLPYNASFDYGETTMDERPVVADSHSCNGLCGPACVELTPFGMWTLDCLEHDECCSDIDADAPNCWVPLGECGDEYEHATADFLRGFSPFGRHCGG